VISNPLDPRLQHHAYGGVEHRKPGPFEDCLLCRIEQLEAEIAALKVINSWALSRVPAWECNKCGESSETGGVCGC
jgi:hypothetical protein